MNGYNDQPASSEVVTDDSELQTPAVDTAAAPQDDGDRVWDALHHVNQELVASNLAPALLIPHLRNRELIEKVADKKTLIANAELLNRDVTEFRQRLSAIKQLHEHRTGSSTDGDDQFASIQINERYMQWAESYESVVLPTVIAMIEPLLDAGAALDIERLTHKSTEIVEHATVVDVNLDAGSVAESSHD